MELRMNFYAAIKEYENTDLNSKLEGSSKHDFIKIVLEELSKNLKTLKYSIENEGKLSKTKSKSFARIITSITVLTSTLDFENGEPIASNLFNLYDFCRREVLDSYKNLTTKGIDDSIDVIEDILSAWKEIG
tara:strand:+ start:293 stop:688 length:396 start_codon:yes stop_codon:yes gene_type:complete